MASALRSRGPAQRGGWAPGPAEPPPRSCRAAASTAGRAGAGARGPRAGRALAHRSSAKAPSLPNRREGRTRPRREGGGLELLLVAFSEFKENRGPERGREQSSGEDLAGHPGQTLDGLQDAVLERARLPGVRRGLGRVHADDG